MIEIKNVCPEDILGMQDVYYKTWLTTYPNKEYGITIEDVEEKFKNRFTEENLNKRTNEILNLPNNFIFLVAKDDNRVVGLCKASIQDDFNELQAIYVLPESQGKGIGRLLWKEILSFFNNNKNIIVHLASYNTGAKTFYSKLGFVDEGRRFIDEKFRMPISGSDLPSNGNDYKKIIHKRTKNCIQLICSINKAFQIWIYCIFT